MHKAKKEIAKRIAQVDVLIEVLDARIPFSSENPMLAELRGDKPCIKVLNKTDLADESMTALWQAHFEQHDHVKTVALCSREKTSASALVATCKDLLPHKLGSIRGIQTLIAGIPNVGKSTLINLLAGKSIAKTGNEPAITKLQQRIDLHNGIVLFDTPGVLWPNVENRNSGFRLAATGAIKDTAMEYEEVALFVIEALNTRYPATLAARYKLPSTPARSLDILEAVGRSRGCLVRGGEVDWQRAAKILVNDLRTGSLGQLTLETPEDKHKELEELVLIRAEKAERKANRSARHKRRK